MDHVVVDVEIQKTIEETPGGWGATDKLGVAVACVWEYSAARMRVYGPEDVEELRNRLLSADRISGFNILNFDFPVIWGLSKLVWMQLGTDVEAEFTCPGSGVLTGLGLKTALLNKTDDMLRRIWQAFGIDPDNYQGKTHGTCKPVLTRGTFLVLDAIAGATLGVGKIGNGVDAPKWYQVGLIQKVVNYCADDVALERDLTDFVERYGYVIVNGKQLKIPAWKGGI